MPCYNLGILIPADSFFGQNPHFKAVCKSLHWHCLVKFKRVYFRTFFL